MFGIVLVGITLSVIQNPERAWKLITSVFLLSWSPQWKWGIRQNWIFILFFSRLSSPRHIQWNAKFVGIFDWPDWYMGDCNIHVMRLSQPYEIRVDHPVVSINFRFPHWLIHCWNLSFLYNSPNYIVDLREADISVFLHANPCSRLPKTGLVWNWQKVAPKRMPIVTGIARQQF